MGFGIEAVIAWRGLNTCFLNYSSKTSSFWPKKNTGSSDRCPLEVYIVFMMFEECLCHDNFKRDIVDTLCHASRRSDTTRPNKAGFLLHEGRVRRVGQLGEHNSSYSSLVGLLYFWEEGFIWTTVSRMNMWSGLRRQKSEQASNFN
jgi:hypothetical protein